MLAQDDVRKRLGDLGLDLIPGTPEEFQQTIAREIPRWGVLIKRLNIKPTE
ncbi:MAG: tripartite tricarboxylate transporter substrate binding protein, partial [Betaproteobacteria bacterium]|nr:tripartite tricarboxylate transporter substrate binding protein [Betaproteobacteria bacterium]